jgi:DNA-directed RNA polymerase subunit M/transcription elongation factor TFIIS
MFCIKCGAKLDDSALFCIKCGAKIDTSEKDVSIPSEQSSTQDSQDKEVKKKKIINGVIAGLFIAVIGYLQFFTFYRINFVLCIALSLVFGLILGIAGKIIKAHFNFPTKTFEKFQEPILGIVVLIIMLFCIRIPTKLIETEALDVVNQIITENQLSKAKCNKVVVTEKISDKMYKGKAYINNDRSVVDIEIVFDGSTLSVEIPAAGLQFFNID